MRQWLIGLVALLCTMGGGQARAGPFFFTKIADTNTDIPDGDGTFTGFLGNPALFVGPGMSLGQGNVAFIGTGSNGQEGVYLSASGTLERVADRNTAMPEDSGNRNFDHFQVGGQGDPSIHETDVAFRGRSSGGSQDGIYARLDGDLTRIADRDTQIPDTTSTFNSFDSTPSVDGGQVGFSGQNSRDGVYQGDGGAPAKLYDSNSTHPRTSESFIEFDSPSLQGNTAAFWARGTDGQGIYMGLGEPAPVQIVADSATPIPEEGTNTFTFFGPHPSLDNGEAAFRGGGLGQQGIYQGASPADLSMIADRNTTMPDSTQPFFEFRDPSLDAGSVAFWGSNNDGTVQGVYTNLGGELVKVIAVGDTLDGKTVTAVSAGRESLSGPSIAFWVQFDDSQAIYMATIPEPSSLALLSLGAAGMLGYGAWKRRRRRS